MDLLYELEPKLELGLGGGNVEKETGLGSVRAK
jgi:hypothetical protein